MHDLFLNYAHVFLPGSTFLEKARIPSGLRLHSILALRRLPMANQIGKFFQSQGHDKAVPGIADHIKKVLGPADAEGDLCGIWMRAINSG